MKVAIIPARGGSKRIPRKNISIFAGQPIISYSIAAALASGLFDRVIVSTEDAEIAAVAKDWGAEVPFLRPETLADDFTGTGAVVRHAIRWLLDQGQPVSHACCIYATAPFVRPDFLRTGYQMLVDSGKSFAFSVTSFPFPIQRAIRVTKEGAVEPFPRSSWRRAPRTSKRRITMPDSFTGARPTRFLRTTSCSPAPLFPS